MYGDREAGHVLTFSFKKVSVTFKSFGLQTEVTVAALVNSLAMIVASVPERPNTPLEMKTLEKTLASLKPKGKCPKKKEDPKGKKLYEERQQRYTEAQKKFEEQILFQEKYYEVQLECLHKTLVLCHTIEAEVEHNLGGGADHEPRVKTFVEGGDYSDSDDDSSSSSE